jgi:hypothetical protein
VSLSNREMCDRHDRPRTHEGATARGFGADDVREIFYAITVERRLRHPAVVAVAEAARDAIFGPRGP